MAHSRWLALLGLCSCVGEIATPVAVPMVIKPVPVVEAPAPVPSPTVLRRLTRAEYRNTVSQIFGVTPPADIELPDDATLNNFVTTAGLSLSASLTTRYLDAAAGIGTRLTPRLTALLGCHASLSESNCLRGWLSGPGEQIFRRPFTEAELNHYVGVFETGRATGTFAAAATLMFEALLSSPQFLFIEQPSGPGGIPQQLDGYQLASKLSFTLWKSAPDVELLAAAKLGTLTTPAALSAQVTRLMADARAHRSVSEFFDGWLALDAIETRTRFSVPERTAMAAESRALVDDVFWQQGAQLRTLLPGLFKQKGVWAAMSANPDSAIIYRGKYVRLRLLCGQLPAPPAGVPPLPELKPGMTSRQRIAAHTAAASCSACHGLMNPLGFALEHYDIDGNWRDTENGLPIDTSVAFKEAGFTAQVTGADDLARQLANSPAAQACAVQQMFTFVFDRRPSAYDQPTLMRLGKEFSRSGHDLRALLGAVVRTPEFASRIAPKDNAP